MLAKYMELAPLLMLQQSTLNELASLGRSHHKQLRTALHEALSQSGDDKLSSCRIPHRQTVMRMPVEVGDFSDFSCSVDHALNAGEAVIGVRQLPPGFLHFPIGYGGRSSSITVSGNEVPRPHGHFKSDGGVIFGPSRAVDFELEFACVIGKPTNRRPVTAEEAAEHIFGFVLLNDWSGKLPSHVCIA
jgi:fumarylacetoacetase